MPDNVVPAPDYIEADPKRPWKAIAAFAFSFLGLIWASLAGRETLDDMTLMEWLSIIIPTILTTGGVYFVRNPKIIDPDAVERNDFGATDLLGAVLVVVLILILLAVFGFLR